MVKASLTCERGKDCPDLMKPGCLISTYSKDPPKRLPPCPLLKKKHQGEKDEL